MACFSKHTFQSWRVTCSEDRLLNALIAMALILLYLSGVGMYQFEHEARPDAFASVFDGLCCAVHAHHGGLR